MATDTKQKIKEAAHKVFKQKGFSATRTRDIAEEAGVNLALLNYYFSSKELLFHEIMIDSIQRFKSTFTNYMHDETVDFPTNLRRMIDSYFKIIIEEPEIPSFVLGELRTHGEEFANNINPRNIVIGSEFEKQMRSYSGNPHLDTSQMFMNIMSLMLFPFVAKPMIQNLLDIDQEGFRKMVEERRKMIPIWVDSMIKNSNM